jgi:hypothetical protein
MNHNQASPVTTDSNSAADLIPAEQGSEQSFSSVAHFLHEQVPSQVIKSAGAFEGHWQMIPAPYSIIAFAHAIWDGIRARDFDNPVFFQDELRLGRYADRK